MVFCTHDGSGNVFRLENGFEKADDPRSDFKACSKNPSHIEVDCC